MKQAATTETLGLVLSSFVQLSSFLEVICYTVGVLAANVNVIQRIKRWAQDETQFESQALDPFLEENWPPKGKIELKSLHTKYKEELPDVLKNINLIVKPGQKVGILGRTGSGKSTLVLALLRILESSGKDMIKIDGVSIDSVSLKTLRRSIVTIPQEPYLLQGSLKFNVDPIGLYSDIEIIESLEKIDLFGSIQSANQAEKVSRASDQNKNQTNSRGQHTDFEGKRELINSMEIEVRGANLSLGQRQLICIARALIQKPKILLTDEATASIDLKADQLIQELIKTEFKDTTVLTIAHRLNTIIEYDKLIVLENGKKVEEGSPKDLLESPGYFYDLVSEGGEQFLKEMMRRAR